MATAMASYIPAHTNDLWILANATVCDARDVASVLPVARPKFLEELLSGLSTFKSVLHLRGGFRRLATRQGKLLARFRAAQPETWSLADCGEMARLLDELLQDEKMLLRSAVESTKRALWWWKDSLATLQTQSEELEQICVRLDALSVEETPMPGDVDCVEFMSLLAAPLEHDLSPDKEHRRVHSLA